MDAWVACPSCQLKHRRRAEGTCPRCAAPVDGAAAPASTVPPADAPPAPEDALWSAAPPAAPLEEDGPTLRLAGTAFVVLALTSLAGVLAGPKEMAAGVPASATFAPSVIDLLIGLSLLSGSEKYLGWARVRVVLGALVWGGLFAVKGDWATVVVQLVASGGLALLLWGGGLARRVVGGVALAGVVALSALGLSWAHTGRSPLAAWVLSLKGELEPLPQGVLEGRRFRYGLTPPTGEHWQLRKAAVTEKENPLADRWLVLADSDVHLMVLGEPVPAGSRVDVALARQNVLAHLSKAFPDLHEAAAADDTFAAERGYVHLSGSVAGQAAEMEVVLRAGDGAFYQLMAFGPQRGYQRSRPALASAMLSFETR